MCDVWRTLHTRSGNAANKGRRNRTGWALNPGKMMTFVMS